MVNRHRRHGYTVAVPGWELVPGKVVQDLDRDLLDRYETCASCCFVFDVGDVTILYPVGTYDDDERAKMLAGKPYIANALRVHERCLLHARRSPDYVRGVIDSLGRVRAALPVVKTKKAERLFEEIERAAESESGVAKCGLDSDSEWLIEAAQAIR
jgi:hypothetical protein